MSVKLIIKRYMERSRTLTKYDSRNDDAFDNYKIGIMISRMKCAKPFIEGYLIQDYPEILE